MLKKCSIYLILFFWGILPSLSFGQRKLNLFKGEHLYERIDSLLVFDPRTYISIKSSQNEYIHCPELSDPVSDTILLSVNQYFNDTLVWFSNKKYKKSKIPTDFTYMNENESNSVIDSIYIFLSRIKQKPSVIKSTCAPEYLNSLISSSGYRYGLFIFQYGYIKSEELYKKQLAGAIIASILTRGLYSGLSEFRSELDLCIVDSSNGSIIFFGKSEFNSNPLMKESYTEHLHWILDHSLRFKNKKQLKSTN